jgi:hypothetical protein
MSLFALYDKGKAALVDKGKAPEISKLHWKADSSSQVCTDASCRKEFNPFSRRKHHCRLCGHLFCQDCLFLERRLNQKAKPDPDGLPSRVCRGCFFDPIVPHEVGNVFDRTADFKSKRKAYGDMNDESKRLQKLVKNMSHVCIPPPPENNVSVVMYCNSGALF